MADALETVAFLASSENRVRLLTAVAEGSRTRAELHEETAITRATLGRVLSDLQDRGWVRQEGTRYEATPEGAHLVSEFESLLDTVGALDDLGDLVAYLPLGEMPFGLDHFRNAVVTRPTPPDSIAPIRRARKILEEADAIVGLTSVFAPEALRANYESVTERRQQFEVVFTSAVIDVITAEAEVRRLLCDLLEVEGVSAYQYDDDLSYPYNIWVIDGEAVIGVSDDEGAPRALIETDDPDVREWVRTTIDAHRSDATRLTAADIPE